MPKSKNLSRRDFLRGACLAGTSFGLTTLCSGVIPLGALASSAVSTQQQTRLLMGTLVTLTAVTGDAARAEAGFHAAFAEMERLVAIFDRHNTASAISVLNDAGSLSSAPQELLAVMDTGMQIARSTQNAFNPAITPVLDLYEKRHADGVSLTHEDPELAAALALAEPSALRIDKNSIRLDRSGMRLTFDGIAKGYIADAASRVLAQKGLRNHMINAGGDIRVQGLAGDRRPWTIGIQHPDNKGGLLTQLSLSEGGIATSGNYEHAYNRSRSSNHLICHRTGRCTESASVTVKAASTMQADAIATALAIMPPTLAVSYVEKQGDAACFIVDRYGRRYVSHNWG